MKLMRSWTSAFAWLCGIGVGGYVVASLFERSDVETIVQILQRAGYASLLVFVPFVIIVSFDSIAWRILFANLGTSVSLRVLAMTRTASEALVLTLPGGVAAAESMKPVFLNRASSLDYPTGIAGVFLKKCFVAISQGMYVLLGFAAGLLLSGTSALSALSWKTVLPLLAGIGVGLIVLGVTGLVLCYSTEESRIVNRLVGWLPQESMRTKTKGVLAQIKEVISRLRTTRVKSLIPVMFLLLGAWLMEMAESYVALHVLSIPSTLPEILAMEVSVSLLRSFVFFVPASVGVKEFGYAAFLAAAGVPDPINSAAAFAVLKRSRELAVICAGYLVIAFIFRRKEASASLEPTPEAS